MTNALILLGVALTIGWAMAAVPAPHRHYFRTERHQEDDGYLRVCACGEIRDRHGRPIRPGD